MTSRYIVIAKPVLSSRTKVSVSKYQYINGQSEAKTRDYEPTMSSLTRIERLVGYSDFVRFAWCLLYKTHMAFSFRYDKPEG